MQPEKSEPKGERKMSEAREIDAEQEIPTRGYTEKGGFLVLCFPAFSVYPQVGISRSTSKTNDWLFHTYYWENSSLY